ncbi:MAG: hypothetical protein QOI28_2896, partial [Mycobacterium sp.]|nr:hypothetical protein [Mycobacterium sp.]
MNGPTLDPGPHKAGTQEPPTNRSISGSGCRGWLGFPLVSALVWPVTKRLRRTPWRILGS